MTTSAINLPRYIALCGHPTSGKSEVQKILRANFDVRPVDDGFALRDYAMRHMGATQEQVFTQEGKKSLAYIGGEPVIDLRTGEHLQWRHVLGRIGNQLEDLFGNQHLPQSAMLDADRQGPGSYSFGSVRKDQGQAYKKRGGLIVGVIAPWAPGTGNDFDKFDATLVDIWINNSVRDLEVLRQSVATLVSYVSIQRSLHAPIRCGIVGPAATGDQAFDVVA